MPGLPQPQFVNGIQQEALEGVSMRYAFDAPEGRTTLADLFAWLGSHGWAYRLRLKGNLLADPGHGDETTLTEARGRLTALGEAK